MSQGSLVMPVVGPVSPATFAGDINTAIDAITSSNSGASAPTNHGGSALQFQEWIDNSAAPLDPWNIFDGTSWVFLGRLNTVTHQWLPFFGAGSPIGLTTIVANTNNWAPAGFATANRFPITAASPFNITGIAGGTDGRIIVLECQSGSSTFTLKAEDTNSTATNRFNLGADKTLDAFQTATFYYSVALGRWRLLSLI